MLKIKDSIKLILQVNLNMIGLKWFKGYIFDLK